MTFDATIKVEYRPTICERCNTLLAKTFTLLNESHIGFHVLCDECYKKRFES